MGRYVKPLLWRLFQFALSLLTLVFLSFGLLKFFPGSPFNEEKNLDPDILLSLEKHYGLHENLLTQISLYLQRIAKGDLGSSMHFVGRSVQSLILEFGQTSAFLGATAFVLAMIAALLYSLSTRVFSQHQRKADFTLLWLMSIPTLAIAPLSLWFFGFYLQWVPVALLNQPSSYVLPILLLTLKPAISLSRILSSSLDLVLNEKYILTARALGFSEFQILRKWALRNSLTSFLSQAGPMFATLISGSFLIEIIFAIPGLGFQFIESVLNRDWPMILGLTLFYGAVLMVTQLITDLFILVSDPRTRTL